MEYRLFGLLFVCLVAACASSMRPAVLSATPNLLYPSDAKEKGIEGSVVLQYDVTVEGFVENVEIISAQPEGIFEKSAQGYVRQWHFSPARKDGVAVPSFAQISTVTFRLAGKDPYPSY